MITDPTSGNCPLMFFLLVFLCFSLCFETPVVGLVADRPEM
jgi:Sec-independent protein secretion pathway component TatC